MEEEKGFFSRVLTTVRDVISITPPAVLTRYWAEAGRNAPQAISIKDKDAAEHHIVLDDKQLQTAERQLHEDFKYISLIAHYHGDLPKFESKLNDKEKAYVGDKFDPEKNKVLEYIEDDKTGLRAAAVQNIATGKVTLVIAGGDLRDGMKELKKDADDVFMITAGDKTSQLAPLYEFAKGVEEKYGHVDKIVGHSLGGHLAFGLAPAFKEAEIVTFDAPGMTPALKHDLQKFYNQTESQIEAAFDGDVRRFRVNDNALNTLGWSPVDVRIGGTKDSIAVGNHFYGDGEKGYLANVIKLGEKLDNGKADVQNDDINNNFSKGPAAISVLMAAGTGGLVAAGPLGIGLSVLGVSSATATTLDTKTEQSPVKPKATPSIGADDLSGYEINRN